MTEESALGEFHHVGEFSRFPLGDCLCLGGGGGGWYWGCRGLLLSLELGVFESLGGACGGWDCWRLGILADREWSYPGDLAQALEVSAVEEC